MPKSGSSLENELDFALRDGVNNEDTSVTVLRSLVTVTTLFLSKFYKFLNLSILVFFIYRHYKLDLDVLKTKEHIDHYGNLPFHIITTLIIETLWTSGKFKYLIIELIICMIHSPPKVNAIFNF